MSGIEIFAADRAYFSPYSGSSGCCLIRDVRGLAAISTSTAVLDLGVEVGNSGWIVHAGVAK